MTTSDRPSDITLDITIAAPLEAVWEALRDPALINLWFGWDYAGIEEEIRQIFTDPASVTSNDGERSLSWTDDSSMRLISADGGTTIVRTTMAAPAGATDWDAVFEETAEGWIQFVQQLRYLFERHPGESRRSLYIAGTVRAGEQSPLAKTLGLDDIGEKGTAYAGDLVTGESVSGEVWYRSRRQIGLTVREYGDGLLVLADTPDGASVTVTSYGQDEATFQAMADRWIAWLRQTYDVSSEYGSPGPG